MRKAFVVALIAAAALATGSASAKMMSCTGENLAKAITESGAMPDGPQKMALMRELGTANTAMSKGDMGSACKSYMRAQKMGLTKS